MDKHITDEEILTNPPAEPESEAPKESDRINARINFDGGSVQVDGFYLSSSAEDGSKMVRLALSTSMLGGEGCKHLPSNEQSKIIASQEDAANAPKGKYTDRITIGRNWASQVYSIGCNTLEFFEVLADVKGSPVVVVQREGDDIRTTLRWKVDALIENSKAFYRIGSLLDRGDAFLTTDDVQPELFD